MKNFFIKLFLIAFLISPFTIYSQGNGVLIGLTKRNAVPTKAISSEECSYYSYNRKEREYQFSKTYVSNTEFIFTDNPLLVYIYKDRELYSDCFCEKRDFIKTYDCEYDYIHTMVYVTTANDFILEFKDGDLYQYYNKNFWGTYLNLIIYEDIDYYYY